MEAKIDAILLAVDKSHGEAAIKNIDDIYEGRHTDAGLKRRIAVRQESR